MHLANQKARLYNALVKKKFTQKLSMKGETMMFFVHPFLYSNNAVLPEILSEDVGAMELRGSMEVTKPKFRFRRHFKLNRKTRTCAPCVCCKSSPCSC